MRVAAVSLLMSLGLCACVSTPPVAPVTKTWAERQQQLQQLSGWDLQGRAAGAVGTQGWQATLDWHQALQTAEIRLAGPLGVGATAFRLTPQGLEYASPTAATAALPRPSDYLQQRLGFAPPFDNLRYWMLGIPNPAQPFDLTPNARDRAGRIMQEGWTIDYGDYTPVGTDVLPSRMTLTRDTARVRIVVERWNLSP